MAGTGTIAKKISKVRTFRDDVAAARGQGEAKEEREDGGASEAIEPTLPRAQTIFRPPEKRPGADSMPPAGTAHQAAAPVIEKKKETPKSPAKDEPVMPVVKNELVIPATPARTSQPIKIEAVPKSIDADHLLSVMDTGADIVEGSIVTDKKRGRFQLLPSMLDAAREWLTEEKEDWQEKVEEKKRAVPTVRPIEKRKEIVEKAAKQSALAPKDDHLQLAKKLPETVKEGKPPKQEALTIKEKSSVAAPVWKHFTGEEAVREEPAGTPTPADVPKAEPTDVPAVSLIPEAPKPPEAAKAPAAEPAATRETPRPVPPPPAVTKLPAAKVVRQRSGLMNLLGRLAVYTFMAAVALGAAGGGIGLVWWLGQSWNQPAPVATAPAAAPAALVRYDQLVRLPLQSGREQFWTAVLSSDHSADLTVIVPTIEEVPATADNVLTAMNWRADGAFLRNIEDINIGFYRGAPFIVLRVISFDTAFGGILAAEDDLSADLSAAFGSSTAAISDFADDTVRNHDIRVQKNAGGGETMVYGFINRNTILIARDRDTFATVAEAIR